MKKLVYSIKQYLSDATRRQQSHTSKFFWNNRSESKAEHEGETFYSSSAPITKLVLSLLLLLSLFNPVQVFAKNKLYWLGDSRTVGISNAVGSDKATFKAEVGKGLATYRVYISEIKDSLGSGDQVVVMFGVNDLGNVNSYASETNNLATVASGKGAKVYFVSVLPTDGALASKHGMNGDINNVKNFNQTIKSLLNDKVTYIDIFSEVDTKWLTDGIHYTADGYKKIYELVKGKLDNIAGSDVSSAEEDATVATSTPATVSFSGNADHMFNEFKTVSDGHTINSDIATLTLDPLVQSEVNYWSTWVESYRGFLFESTFRKTVVISGLVLFVVALLCMALGLLGKVKGNGEIILPGKSGIIFIFNEDDMRVATSSRLRNNIWTPNRIIGSAGILLVFSVILTSGTGFLIIRGLYMLTLQLLAAIGIR